MADALMSLLEEAKARREEWRAADLLLSVPVSENLTDVTPSLCGKMTPLPSIPALPAHSQRGRGHEPINSSLTSEKYLDHVEINDEDYGALRLIEGVSLGAMYQVATDGSDSLSPIGTRETREPTELPLWSLAWRTCTCTARATPERPRRSPRFAKEGRCTQTTEAVKLAHAMTTAGVFTKLGRNLEGACHVPRVPNATPPLDPIIAICLARPSHAPALPTAT